MVSGLRDSVVAFHATADPDSVAAILDVPGPPASGGPNDSIALIAADRFGNPVPLTEINWSYGRSEVPNIDTTSDSGVIRIPLLEPNDSLILSSLGLEVVIPPAIAPSSPDGATWIERVSGVPPARVGHALVYDPANGYGVLFGGMATDRLADMWLWASGGWNEARPPSRPPARMDHAMAFDGASVILFGGVSGSTVWDDLWMWDGRDWTEITVPRGPAGRYGHAMVRDAVRGLVVLFGGVAGQGIGFSDTWTWDGSSWRAVSSALSPSERLGHAMAYDSERQRVVLYGGSNAGGIGGLLRDTWEYAGNTWSRVPTPVAPPGVTGHAMTYDEARGRVVLFGGASVSGPMSETWEYDGRSWTRRTTSDQPEPREDATMFFDPTRGRVVLYGGAAGVRYSDTWEYRIP
jgi:hypothetical protein